MKKKSFLYKLIPAAAIAGVAAAVSGSMNNYIMTLANMALIYFLCSAGLSVLFGMGGQLAMCSVTFMGLGGFLAGQLAKNYAVASLPALILAVAMTTIVGLLFGLVLMRLKGGFLVFGTIGLVNIGSTLYSNFTPLSGGPDGIFGIPKLQILGYTFNSMQAWFFLLMVIAVVVILLISRIRSTSLGRNLMAVRDDETAAYTLGVHVYKTKVIAFTISCALCGLAGALLAFHNGVVSYSLFTFTSQMQFVMMVMLGGVNSIVGTLAGTFLIMALPELLRSLANYMSLIYGLATILLMIFMPMGIGGIVDSSYKKFIRRRKDASAIKVNAR